MSASSTNDDLKTHSHFAASCFNVAWDLIDKEIRTEEEDLRMLDLVHSSLWHWRERSDCAPSNLAIGYWQAARVYALIKEANLARLYGKKSLELTEDSDFFNRAFAHEAIARAEMIAENKKAMVEHLERARQLADNIGDEKEAAWLEQNLETISL